MNGIRKPITMLIAGTLAGFLSGLMEPIVFGLRGAATGLCLSSTVLLARSLGWKSLWPYLPGAALGFVLAYCPIDFSLYDTPPEKTYDAFTLINGLIFIPLLAFAYLKDPLKKRIGLLMLFGLLSCVLRSWSFEADWRAAAFVIYNFPLGMLPFLGLWLLAMKLADPRFSREEQTT